MDSDLSFIIDPGNPLGIKDVIFLASIHQVNLTKDGVYVLENRLRKCKLARIRTKDIETAHAGR